MDISKKKKKFNEMSAFPFENHSSHNASLPETSAYKIAHINMYIHTYTHIHIHIYIHIK